MGKGAKFLEVELDPSRGSNYTVMGTTQLRSVPYALHSANTYWSQIANDISNTNSGNIGTSTPASSAAVEIASINKGFVMPRKTTTQRNNIVSPIVGSPSFLSAY